jgi:hypothetical protein
MLDSITVANLPDGADAYLGYVDGHFATFPALRQAFPVSHLLDLAVFSTEDATGCDCEQGDLRPGQVPGWVARQLGRGVFRPVVYASASVMPSVLALLLVAGINRADVRVLTAHYGAGKHICGPATCKLLAAAADGTQWTDQSPGLRGSRVDESLLADGFFAPRPAPPKPPAPASALEPDMILVTVDHGSVPAGTPWPGVFLVTPGAAPHHVTGPDDGIDNVKAYQSAGIKGPVTISWPEFQGWAGGK